MKKAYMHTLDGKPAMFDGDQVCFLPKSRAKDVLRDSLQQIKHEQIKSDQWRKSVGFGVSEMRYGHRMFYV